MTRTVRIALDAMGGDFGPAVVVPGAELALERHPDATFLLFGIEDQVKPVLARHPKLAAKAEFRAAEVVIGMDAKPSQALRQGRGKSSMWQAIDAVKKGEADVAVSAGNTGALMAMSRLCLRMMPGIDRPAIAAMWPTMRGESIVLDVGASIANIVFDLEKPTVGLLNVGVEEIKGVEQVKEAGRLLREANIASLTYHGFIEGDDIGKGTTDVVVTEGFAGNIALKTAEGTAKQIAAYLKAAMSRTTMSKVGYLFAKSAFDALRERMDPRKVNGGVFLGLDGVVIKSHGGTDAIGFASAIDIAYDMVQYELLTKIRDMITNSRIAPGGAGEDSTASEGSES
ncbi:MAG: phosphate acyltransferase PlsX [Proteobacteria bacterium]|nr:phosphate acyltransferase PlsX [Pseudomonadota bacterium]